MILMRFYVLRCRSTNRVLKYVQYSPDLLSCAIYYTDALDSNELSVSNILCLCPIDGPCLFQTERIFLFLSFLTHGYSVGVFVSHRHRYSRSRSLSFTNISGGAAPILASVIGVSPKTWRISASADARSTPYGSSA